MQNKQTKDIHKTTPQQEQHKADSPQHPPQAKKIGETSGSPTSTHSPARNIGPTYPDFPLTSRADPDVTGKSPINLDITSKFILNY